MEKNETEKLPNNSIYITYYYISKEYYSGPAGQKDGRRAGVEYVDLKVSNKNIRISPGSLVLIII